MLNANRGCLKTLQMLKYIFESLKPFNCEFSIDVQKPYKCYIMFNGLQMTVQNYVEKPYKYLGGS